MVVNLSKKTPDNKMFTFLNSMMRKIESLKTNQLATMPIPELATDPSAPFEGQMWINTTSNTIKIYQNATTKTFTTT